MPQPASLHPPEPEGLGQVRDEQHFDEEDDDDEDDDDNDDDDDDDDGQV